MFLFLIRNSHTVAGSAMLSAFRNLPLSFNVRFTYIPAVSGGAKPAYFYYSLFVHKCLTPKLKPYAPILQIVFICHWKKDLEVTAEKATKTVLAQRLVMPLVNV